MFCLIHQFHQLNLLGITYSVFCTFRLVNTESWCEIAVLVHGDGHGVILVYLANGRPTLVKHDNIVVNTDSDRTVTGGLLATLPVECMHLERTSSHLKW